MKTAIATLRGHFLAILPKLTMNRGAKFRNIKLPKQNFKHVQADIRPKVWICAEICNPRKSYAFQMYEFVRLW